MKHSGNIKMGLIAVGAILLMASNAFAMRSVEYLETMDLKDLCIVSFKNLQGYWAAQVKDPNGYFHTVTVGSHIGKNTGVVTKISNDTVEVIELIQGAAGDWVDRPMTLPVGCPMIPPCANSQSDGSPIVWLLSKHGKEPIHLGMSVGDRRAWRWVYAESRGIQPATSEEVKELIEEYGGERDLSRLDRRCATPR